MPPKSLTVEIILSILVLAVAIYLVIGNRPAEFNRQLWIESGSGPFSKEAPRLTMADGLVRSRVLIGMSLPEVEAMLGPQSEAQYFRREYDLVYWLGAERNFISIDSEWLVLKLSRQGMVTEARIVTD